MPAQPALSAEWSLLRAACCEDSAETKQLVADLLSSPLQWNTVLDLAERHGVLPLLTQALSDTSTHVPPDVSRSLRQSYQTNVHKALFLSRELIRILDKLSTAGVKVMPYKGLALAEIVYGDIALRQPGDIDLLIRPRDFARVREAVQELGYVPHLNLSPAEEGAYLKSGYECAFDGPAGKNLLEVQWAIQPGFYAVDLDMHSIFQREVDVTVAGCTTKSPSMEDLFLILALHAAKHLWGRLIWICDIARLSKLSTLNWSLIGRQAEELGVVRILRVSLILASQLARAPIPAEVEKNLPADTVASKIADEIEDCIVRDTTINPGSLEYYRWMVRLRERRIDRMRIVRRLVLTPGPGEWAMMSLPKPLFPIYRLIRLGRLGARFVRNRM
jgi:putative nucleotidyltransferase-like protein